MLKQSEIGQFLKALQRHKEAVKYSWDNVRSTKSTQPYARKQKEKSNTFITKNYHLPKPINFQQTNVSFFKNSAHIETVIPKNQQFIKCFSINMSACSTSMPLERRVSSKKNSDAGSVRQQKFKTFAQIEKEGNILKQNFVKTNRPKLFERKHFWEEQEDYLLPRRKQGNKQAQFSYDQSQEAPLIKIHKKTNKKSRRIILSKVKAKKNVIKDVQITNLT